VFRLRCWKAAPRECGLRTWLAHVTGQTTDHAAWARRERLLSGDIDSHFVIANATSRGP
jgi:hypothetical protein